MVNTSNVETLLGLDVTPDGQDAPALVTRSVEIAQNVIDEDFTSSSASENRKNAIGENLAAHFYTMAKEKGEIEKERVGDAETEYVSVSGVFSQGYGRTRYGQTALSLDRDCILRSKRKLVFRAMV